MKWRTVPKADATEELGVTVEQGDRSPLPDAEEKKGRRWGAPKFQEVLYCYRMRVPAARSGTRIRRGS